MKTTRIDPNTSDVDIISASFYWKNNEPGGLGFSFAIPVFQPSELRAMFFGTDAKTFIRESDNALGSNIVATMLQQLEYVANLPPGQRTLDLALLCALNILWLSERGFIPQDEFNGTQFIGGIK